MGCASAIGTAPELPNAAADVLDDVDRLAAHALTDLVRAAVVRPPIAAADAGASDADHRVGGLLDRRVRGVLDPDIVRFMHLGGTHWPVSSECSARTASAPASQTQLLAAFEADGKRP